MKNSTFTETQIVSILKEAEAGMAVKEVCRLHGISSPAYYEWKARYGGLGASELKRMKELEAENAKLKPQVRHDHRQRHACPVLDELRSWLDEVLPQVPPTSTTGKALNYLHNE